MYHGPCILDIVPPEAEPLHVVCPAERGTRCSTTRYSTAEGGAPRCCVKEKAERSGAAATLCRIDLYVVCSRSKFIHEPQYVVGR